MEVTLSEQKRTGIVRTVDDNLSQAQRSALREKIGELRETLDAFARQFALERHPLGIRQVLDAELSTAIVMLENCRPARMKGYGQPFEDSAGRALEENVDRLLAHAETLRALLR